MTLDVGTKLPAATLHRKGPDGLEAIALADRLAGRKAVIFAVPGAFTPTCDSAHMPSFVRTIDAFRAKGVDEIICISVNDIHVMDLWGQTTGATDAGITLLADGDSTFTKAIGMAFSAPEAGLIDRSKRYAMIVDDGVVTAFNIEASPGVCDVSAGEALLELL
ncbi:peroxiredoxin [Pseudoruegeria sp. SK021]|uniref:peroxiredoxin n=1 Tax=Pseudoruegeria sp. SK021 TaxID=1933035 RepID=UPI000A225541|nr:peroxiredoxin [Pseudoruegeria sp. SK021]OSP54174.1 peroxiredoxin [Pseudoruegeria sp. SK021]